MQERMKKSGEVAGTAILYIGISPLLAVAGLMHLVAAMEN